MARWDYHLASIFLSVAHFISLDFACEPDPGLGDVENKGIIEKILCSLLKSNERINDFRSGNMWER